MTCKTCYDGPFFSPPIRYWYFSELFSFSNLLNWFRFIVITHTYTQTRKHIIIMSMYRHLYKITSNKKSQFAFQLIPFCISFSLFRYSLIMLSYFFRQMNYRSKQKTSLVLSSFLVTADCFSLLMFFNLRLFRLQLNVHKYTYTPVCRTKLSVSLMNMQRTKPDFHPFV